MNELNELNDKMVVKTINIVGDFIKNFILEQNEQIRKEEQRKIEYENHKYNGDVIYDMDTLIKIIIKRKKIHIGRNHLDYKLITSFRHDSVDYYTNYDDEKIEYPFQEKIEIIEEETDTDGTYVIKRFTYNSDISIDICYYSPYNIEDADDITFIFS
jgi:hypothetical protein